VTVLAALVAGFVAAALLQRTMRGTLAHPVLARENYRGHALPTAAGFVLVAAVVAVDGGRAVLGLLGAGDAATAPARLLVLAAVVAFGFLGLLDDLLGDAYDRGLSGHLRAAVRGRVTTGFVKLGGGTAVALVLAGTWVGDRPLRVVVDGAVIALAANVGNLLDRAPGRTTKWGLLGGAAVLAVAGSSAAGVALAVVLGAAAALLAPDLREELMLGDTGANALGAAIGVATVIEAPPAARSAVAAALFALTLLSEVVSFSRIIDAVPPLRWFDRLGRRSDP